MTRLSVRSEGIQPGRWTHSAGALLGIWLTVITGVASPNQALKLDGKEAHVALPPHLAEGLTQATVEAWARWDAFANYSRVFEFGAPWQSMSIFNQGTNNDLRFNLYPQYAKLNPKLLQYVRVEGVLRSNEWIHLAAVSGPGGMELYVNGRLAGQHTNTASFADLPLAGTNYFGRSMSGNVTDRNFQGEIDEVRVWNHRRSPAQIRQHMFKRLSGQEDGLVHLWNFDDGTANDAGPHSAHGTLMAGARVGVTDLGLVADPVVPLAVAGGAPMPLPAVEPQEPRTAIWWIAGALSALVFVLAWLAFMFRRSGLGSEKLVGASAHEALQLATAKAAGELPENVTPELKERALAELTSFAKESLVQGLYSQRQTLLAAQQQAQEELAKLETRLASMRLPERIQAYEERIGELEQELETRNGELRELTRATLDLLRQRLAAERRDQEFSRFN